MKTIGKKTHYGEIVNGNQRVLWAIENDYTHIEALEVKTRDERDTINKITFISQDEYPL